MSNIVNTNPMRLDTEGVATTRNLFVTAIKWNPVGSPAVGHIVELTDAAGNVVWRHIVNDIGTANNVLVPEAQTVFANPIKARGLTLSDLDSGELFVYHQGTRHG